MSAINSTLVPDLGRQRESRASQLTTAAIVCPIFAAVFTILRIYTRLVLIKKYFWEDLTIVVALVCAVVFSIFMQIGVIYGTGRHTETISANDLIEGVEVGIAVTQFYSLSHFCVKLSILLQYVRIGVMPSDKRLCYTLITILCAGYSVFIVMRMVRCIPFSAQWDPTVPGAKCFFTVTWFTFPFQIWNMVMDIVVLLVPVFILRHLNVPLLHRALIGVVLALGGFACIISIIRIQTLYQTVISVDPSWDRVPAAVYSLIEVNVGIICASVVTLRPLLHRLQQRFFKKTQVSQQTPTEMERPDFMGRPRFSDDTVLTTVEWQSSTRVGSVEHDAELGGSSQASSSRRGKTGEARQKSANVL